eukprot:1938131-Pyramimonas_sp.AAC.1
MLFGVLVLSPFVVMSVMGMGPALNDLDGLPDSIVDTEKYDYRCVCEQHLVKTLLSLCLLAFENSTIPLPIPYGRRDVHDQTVMGVGPAVRHLAGVRLFPRSRGFSAQGSGALASPARENQRSAGVPCLGCWGTFRRESDFAGGEFAAAGVNSQPRG